MMNDSHLSLETRSLLGITAYNLARSPGEQRDAKTIYDELVDNAPLLSSHFHKEGTYNGLT